MPATAVTAGLPSVPLDVLDFALKRRSADHIRTVLEVAREAFPEATLRLYLEADPELADESRIIVEADVSDWTAERMGEADDAYHQQIGRALRPQDYVGIFCLRLGAGR